MNPAEITLTEEPDSLEHFAAAAPAAWGGRLGDVLVVLVPAVQFFEVRLIGRLFLTDILWLILFPFALISRHQLLARGLPRTFLLLGLAWLAAQIAVDLVRATPADDCARGWAMIGLTLTNFTSIYVLLHESSHRVVLFAIGTATGQILSWGLDPLYTAFEPWKFGYGPGVTLLLVVLAASAMRRSGAARAAEVMIVAAALNLYNGSRSAAGECAMTMSYIVLHYLSSPLRGAPSRFAGKLGVGSYLLFTMFLTFHIYDRLASTGMLGPRAEHIYEVESAGSLGVFAGGRADVLVGAQAILESPVIGYGSWAKDWRFGDRIGELTTALGYSLPPRSTAWVIPSHSHLIGAWVEAGVIGALFWLWVLSLPLRVLNRLYLSSEPIMPLLGFIAFLLVWDILFSPYGAERRFMTPYYIAAMMWALESFPRWPAIAPWAEGGEYARL